jgi:hypothetical protein
MSSEIFIDITKEKKEMTNVQLENEIDCKHTHYEREGHQQRINAAAYRRKRDVRVKYASIIISRIQVRGGAVSRHARQRPLRV